MSTDRRSAVGALFIGALLVATCQCGRLSVVAYNQTVISYFTHFFLFFGYRFSHPTHANFKLL
jgi:hypothetical protein